MSRLEGLRVVECDSYFTSSFIGKTLSDLGSEVILVKGSELHETDFINSVNEGKYKLILDFKRKNAIEMFKSVIKNSDILIDSYRSETLEEIGLNPECLIEVNPKLIILRLSYYRQEGEFKIIPGQGVNCTSFSGLFENLMRNNQSKSLSHTGIIGDIFGGSAIYFLTKALFQRSLTGKGGIIDSNSVGNLFDSNSFATSLNDNEFQYFTFISKDQRFLLLKIKNEEKNLEIFFNLLEKIAPSKSLFKDELVELAKTFNEEYLMRYFNGYDGITIIPTINYKDSQLEFSHKDFPELKTSFDINGNEERHKLTLSQFNNKSEFLKKIGFSNSQIEQYLLSEELRMIKPKF